MWDVSTANKMVEQLGNAQPVLMTRGKSKGQHRQYAFRYEIKGRLARHISIDRRSRMDGVAVYVNLLSVDGVPFPDDSIDGVDVTKRVPKGYVGRTGDQGISAAAAGLASLDPKTNEVLIMRVKSARSFEALLVWYAGLPSKSSSDPPKGMSSSGSELGRTAGRGEPSAARKADSDVEVETLALQRDPKKRSAVERHAVLTAIDYFGKDFQVEERGAPYDLQCVKGSLCVHVEVKGTTTNGDEVILTSNEVRDACDPNWRSDLFVVYDITLDSQNGEWFASGGKIRHIENWAPADGDLRPFQYRYRVPLEAVAE